MCVYGHLDAGQILMSCCYFRRHVDVLWTFLINFLLSGLHTFCRSLNK